MTATSRLAIRSPAGDPAFTSANARRLRPSGTRSATASENGAHAPPALVPARITPTARGTVVCAVATSTAPTASRTQPATTGRRGPKRASITPVATVASR